VNEDERGRASRHCLFSTDTRTNCVVAFATRLSEATLEVRRVQCRHAQPIQSARLLRSPALGAGL
jgi:hypothetical protein